MCLLQEPLSSSSPSSSSSLYFFLSPTLLSPFSRLPTFPISPIPAFSIHPPLPFRILSLLLPPPQHSKSSRLPWVLPPQECRGGWESFMLFCFFFFSMFVFHCYHPGILMPLYYLILFLTLIAFDMVQFSTVFCYLLIYLLFCSIMFILFLLLVMGT